jgi:hypothetical protein
MRDPKFITLHNLKVSDLQGKRVRMRLWGGKEMPLGVVPTHGAMNGTFHIDERSEGIVIGIRVDTGAKWDWIRQDQYDSIRLGEDGVYEIP